MLFVNNLLLMRYRYNKNKPCTISGQEDFIDRLIGVPDKYITKL